MIESPCSSAIVVVTGTTCRSTPKVQRHAQVNLQVVDATLTLLRPVDRLGINHVIVEVTHFTGNIIQFPWIVMRDDLNIMMF